MGAASEWEQNFASHIEELKKANNADDINRVHEILNQIAPHPTGPNVRDPDGLLDNLFGRLLEVIDPNTGELDNPDGPAVIEGDETRKWYRFGMLHNISGPAIIEADGALEYYYLGQSCASAAEVDQMVEAAAEHEERSTDWQDIQRGKQ